MKALEQKFSMRQAAAQIGVHVATVSRLLDNGKLGYYQIGARRVVGQKHLEDFLARVERKPKASH
jgi:excisionase family DNA binding protein